MLSNDDRGADTMFGGGRFKTAGLVRIAIGGAILVASACALYLHEQGSPAGQARAATPMTHSMAVADRSEPADMHYAVQGVLDYRSWRPEYDTMPIGRVPVYAGGKIAAHRPATHVQAHRINGVESAASTSSNTENQIKPIIELPVHHDAPQAIDAPLVSP